ncbi:hypothetical protein PC123_g22408 [Phytophthora cactorum]|nr:hypothetical protein PC123_g22408 [Phytophthora cactorum]
MAGSAPTMNTTVDHIRSNGEQLDAIDVGLGPEHDMSSGDEAETPKRLRKECTEIKLRFPRTTPKPEQIKHLKDHDAAYMVVQTTVDDEYTIEPRLRKAKHYCVRLLYVLFSDRFAIRLVSSEDAATRKQIDAGGVNLNTQFWNDVTD